MSDLAFRKMSLPARVKVKAFSFQGDSIVLLTHSNSIYVSDLQFRSLTISSTEENICHVLQNDLTYLLGCGIIYQWTSGVPIVVVCTLPKHNKLMAFLALTSESLLVVFVDVIYSVDVKTSQYYELFTCEDAIESVHVSYPKVLIQTFKYYLTLDVVSGVCTKIG